MKQIEKAESGKRGDTRMSEQQKQADLERAFSHFTSSCVACPQFALAYYKRGKCYMMMHDYKRALYDFSAAFFNQDRHEVFQQNKDNPKPQESASGLYYMHAGMCNYNLGMYEEALAHYEVASKRDKDDSLTD